MARNDPKMAPKMAPNAYHEAPLATFLLSRAGGMRGAIEFGRSLALAKDRRVKMHMSICLSLIDLDLSSNF